MIVKYGSGTGGIKEYLEEGKKNGREQSRDDLDDRIILAGDLDICDQIINSRPTDGQKYQHISLSFTEDELKINPDLLKQIVDDYAKFARGDGAYTEDELYVYAEAHMPKTQTEEKWNADKKCYEIVPRLIHVHIVIPTTNLLTGARAAPFEALPRRFGTADRLDDFTDAWQENINAKHGFSSPHDPAHARDSFGGQADIISRIKGDEFADRKFKNHDKLKLFRNEMLDRSIESEAAFKDMLGKLGYEVADKVGHGKNGDYLRVRPTGTDEKYVRLDDDQFRTEFLNLTISQKLQVYANKKIEAYEVSKPAAAAERARLSAAWGERARAEKYMSYGSKVHKEYLAASPEDRKLLIELLEAKHYGKIGIEHERFDKLLADERNLEMSEEGRAEQLRLEMYSSAKLNASYLRTSDQTAAASLLGEAILAEPATAISALTFSQSTFNEGALQKFLLKNTADADQYDAAMRAVLANPELVVQQTDKGLLFTSREIVSIEKNLVARAERMAGNMRQSRAEIDAALSNEKKHGVVATIINDVLLGVRALNAATTLSNIGSIFGLKPIGSFQSINAVPGIPQDKIDAIAAYKDDKGRGMNEGQQAAFKLLCSDRQLGVINGAAGTGKSFILAKMNSAYMAEGFKVYGGCLQGKTASDLQHDSKIETRTIAKMLKELEKGKLVFDKKSVLVIDEAGMVGSRDLEKLMGYIEKAGGRIRLVGDAYQLAAVEYGNAFVEISKRAEVAALTQIMRQETKWMKEASEKFSRHDITGLQDYADHGKVSIEDTTKDAQISIVAKWSAHREDQPKQTCIVLAHTNAERVQLNDMMRAELKRHGELKNEIAVTTSHGVMQMAVGERIMFTAPDRKMGVKNGTTGTIIAIDKDGFISVKLDNEDKIAVFNKDGRGTKEGNEVTHGYCVTVHKAQGATVDKCLVLANSSMSLENLYVGMTRHRHDVEIVASAEQFATIDDMVKGLDRAGHKAFSADNENTWQSTDRPSDSVVGQLLAEINATKVIEAAALTASYKEINANLEAKRVLDYVSKTHGVDVAKYEVITDDSGKQRIQSGDTSRDVTSFLTKVLHLDYLKEAAPILKQCYAEQLENVYSVSRYDEKGINQQIKNEFADYLKKREFVLKIEKEKLDEEKRTAKTEIDKSALTPEEKTLAHKELSDRIASDKVNLKIESEKPTAKIYKDFLVERAPDSELHMNELLRASITPDDRERIADIEASRLATQEQVKSSYVRELAAATGRLQQAAKQARTAEQQRIEEQRIEAEAKIEKEKEAAAEKEKQATVPDVEIERDEREEIRKAVELYCASTKHAEKPIIDSDCQPASRTTGTIAAVSDNYFAVIGHDKVTVHPITESVNQRLTTDGSTTPDQALVPGNEADVSYWSNGKDVSVEITEKRQEMQKAKELDHGIGF